MKLFPNQIQAINHIIQRVINEKCILDTEIKFQIDKNKRWGARDRRNFYQACYDIIRNYELFEHLANGNERTVIGIYLDLLAQPEINIHELHRSYPDLPFQISNSITNEIYDLYLAQTPNAEENIQAMQHSGNIYLRVNTSLISVQDFGELLNAKEIEYKIISEFKLQGKNIPLDAIQLSQSTNHHKEFFADISKYYEIQDIGSQTLTAMIDMSEAEVIVETCAGQGGKTMDILNRTRKKNPLIIAMDSQRKKLEHLELRASKWSIHKLVTEKLSPKIVEKYSNMADILYMDMPCTGSGTLRRQADMKYRITNENLQEKIALQRSIFLESNELLKAGGQLIYTTCSLFRAENEDQVDWISSQGYQINEKILIEPKDSASDGFFYANLTKKSA